MAAYAAQQWGTDRFIRFDERSVSFDEINVLAGRLASGLAARGVGRGERVILHLPNDCEWVVAYHAIARLGGVVVPANFLLTPGEVKYIIADSGARAIVTADERGHLFREVADLVVTPGGDGTVVAFADLMEAEPLAPVEVGPDDLLTIGYTSGTTGAPKGVMLSQGNVFASVMHTATYHVRHAQDCVYSALPFPHVYGNVVMNACFLVGASLVAPRRFDAGAALAAIAQHRVTLFEGVPTMYFQMLAHPAINEADLSSLTRCTVGGQSMPIAKCEAVAERFGCPVLELWGMTELAGPAVSHSPYWPARHGSIGIPFPGVEVRLADLEQPERAAAPRAPGELMVRGPLVMKGYWNRADATHEAIDPDGWLATGDIAKRDEDGYLAIVDRKKDMILTAGYNVYPAELEQAIARHPDVTMVAVAGFPDAEKGEIAHAFVVLRPDAVITAHGIIDHCRENLASYKVPRAVHILDDLPQTSSGKILRRALSPSTASITAPAGRGDLS